jgi:hypothetical protein
MPLCTNCGSHDVEQIDDNEYACTDCDATFIYEGGEPDYPAGPSDAEIAEAVDMQTFEDRMNPCGDD